MPYILDTRRDALYNDSLEDFDDSIKDAGELNYIITNVLITYMRTHGKSYKIFNDISGAMTESLAEFRRRIIVPYEDKKIEQNGDIYLDDDLK